MERESEKRRERESERRKMKKESEKERERKRETNSNIKRLRERCVSMAQTLSYYTKYHFTHLVWLYQIMIRK